MGETKVVQEIRRRTISFLLTFILAMATPVFAEVSSSDPEKLKQELESLEAEIAKFQELMKNTENQKSDLEDTLEVNEKSIGRILKKIKQIQEDLVRSEDKLSSLTGEQNQLNKQKAIQQDHIIQQIRASHELGNQQYLKVVLNQEDPNQLARMLTYYDYFNRARLERIESYEATIAELDIIEAKITAQVLSLNNQQMQLDEQKSGLLVVQAQKELVLVALNEEISRTGDAIEKRESDRERLEALLERIVAGIANLPTSADAVPFSNMRGNLFLPAAGKIIRTFGARRSEGKLRWDGVLIKTDEGEPVHSIHYGRVVFSDWLRGYGLLLIINHGEGYMSLYGHNQVLFRETGDWVTAGELIANVGNSGGQRESGLYFEIRSAGKPSDPQLWCHARPVKAA
jgi:septal ring factor EnvC (AmiA/AmiB activator)